MAESSWTDELKAQVIEDYLAGDPTPDNSMDLVKAIAEDIGKTVNGVRMILSKADVYVKKTPSTTSTTKDDGEKKEKKMSKADAVAALKAAIEEAGAEVDDKVIDKITGIAAQYFTGVIKAAKGD